MGRFFLKPASGLGKFFSPTVLVIIVSNVFITLLLANGWYPVLQGGELVPYEIAQGVDLVGAVGTGPNRSLAKWYVHFPALGSIYLTPLSYMFLHSSWKHMLLNMLGLWMFGVLLEYRLGWKRFMLLYLLGGLLAGIAAVFYMSTSIQPINGASAAVCAVIAAYWLTHADQRVSFFGLGPKIFPTWIFPAGWFLYQVTGLIDPSEESAPYFGHLVGGLVGAGLAYLFTQYSSERKER